MFVFIYTAFFVKVSTKEGKGTSRFRPWKRIGTGSRDRPCQKSVTAQITLLQI